MVTSCFDPRRRGLASMGAIVWMIALAVGCAGPVGIPQPDRSSAGPSYFGYAAIVCGHDDPLDNSQRRDYMDEVADFTNANQVCVTDDVQELADRLRRVPVSSKAVLYVEPVFFAFDDGHGRSNRSAQALWALVRQAIAESGVSAERLVFYVADEPVLRGMAMSDVEDAVAVVDGSYPEAATLLVEAYRQDGASPVVPAWVDYWGFTQYGVRNPETDVAYRSYMDDAVGQLRPGQKIALIMDASYTPAHASLGWAESDMATVADNYFALAKDVPQVDMVLAYTWAGGIDSLDEKGVRDMDPAVAAAHRRIGRAIVGAARQR